jgi:hypothetical protein
MQETKKVVPLFVSLLAFSRSPVPMMDVDWPTRRPAVSVITLLLFSCPLFNLSGSGLCLCGNIRKSIFHGFVHTSGRPYEPPIQIPKCSSRRLLILLCVSQSRKIWGCLHRARATALISIATQPQPEFITSFFHQASLSFCQSEKRNHIRYYHHPTRNASQWQDQRAFRTPRSSSYKLLPYRRHIDTSPPRISHRREHSPSCPAERAGENQSSAYCGYRCKWIG